MSSELDMTGIDEERIRRFVRDGKNMDEDEISFFLDSPCLELTLRNFPARLAGLLAELPQAKKGLIAGIAKGEAEDSADIKLWVPAFHIMPLMDAIREIFKAVGMENPYELMDFEAIEKAGPGRDYVTAMLICARDAGQDIS